MNPLLLSALWRAAPWLLIAALGAGIYVYHLKLNAAQEAQEKAEDQLVVVSQERDWERTKRKEDDALLAERELEREADTAKLDTMTRRLRAYVPAEKCLDLDTAYPWLDGLLLPNGP